MEAPTVDHRDSHQASQQLSSLVDLVIQGTADSKPWLHDAILYCAVPHWFDVEIIHGMRSPHSTDLPDAFLSGGRADQNSEISDQAILDELKKLPFCQEHPIRGWTYHEDIRAYLLNHPEIRSHWETLHLRAAGIFDQLCAAKGLEGSDRFQDAGWRDLTIEWLYHQFNLEPTSALAIIKHLCAEALAEWQVDFCAEFLGGLNQRLMREQPNATIHDLKNQVDALGIYNNVKALPMLQELTQLPGLTDTQRASLHYWVGTIHLGDEDLLAPGLEELDRAKAFNPGWAEVDAAIANVYFNAIAESYASRGATWGNYTRALEFAEKARQIAHTSAEQEGTPENVMGYTTLARIECQLEAWEAALQYCQTAIKLNPTAVDGYLTLSEVYAARNAPGDLDRVFENLDQVNEIDPSSSYDITIRRGDAYSTAHCYEEALREYDKAQQSLPDRSKAYLACGNLYRVLGQSAKAEEQYTRVIELLPDMVDGYQAMAQLYVSQERWERAIDCCHQALAQGVQKKKILYFILSDIYRQLLNDPACQHDCLDRLAQNQNEIRQLDRFEDYTYRCMMGDAYLTEVRKHQGTTEAATSARNDHLRKAQDELEQAIAIDPGRAWAYLSLADLAVLRQDNASIQQLEETVRKETPRAEYDFLTSLGEAYLRNHQATECEAVLQRAVADAPHRLRAWFAFSDLYSWLGNPAEVARVQARLVRLNSALRYQASIAAGRAYQDVGNRKLARRKYQRAKRLEPKQATADFYLASLDEAVGYWDKAIAHYTAAIENYPDAASVAYTKISALKREQGQREPEGQRELEQYRSAEEFVRKAILANPEQPDAYLELGCLGAVQNNEDLIQEARDLLRQKTPQKHYDFEYAVGETYRHRGAYPRARDRYNACIKQAPERPEAYIGLGKVLIQRHDYAGAKETLLRAIAIDSTCRDAYLALSRLAEVQEDVQALIEVQQQIAALVPTEQYKAAFYIGESYRKAYESSQQSDLGEQAEREYRRAIALAPWRPDAYIHLGLLLTEMRKADAAEQVYQQGQDAAGINYLSTGQYYERLGKYPEALKIYHLGIAHESPELKPDLFDCTASLHHQLKQYAQAKEDYQQAIQLAPKAPNAYVGLMRLLTDQHRFKEAVRVADQMAQHSELQYEAYCSLGQLLLEQGQYRDAEQAYQRAIDVDPQHPDAYLELANTYQQHQDFEQAEQLYRQVITNQPQVADAYVRLGQLMTDQGRVEEAIAVCQHMAQQPGLAYQGYVSLGNLLGFQGNDSEAEAAYQRALEIDRQNTSPYLELVRLYQQQKRPESAELLLRKVLTLEPDNVPARVLLGKVLSDRQQFTEAEEILQAASQLDLNNVEAFTQLGQIYEAQNKLEQAEKTYSQAIAIAPRDPAAYLGLIRIYGQQGQTQSADQMERHLLQLKLEERHETHFMIAVAYDTAGCVSQAEALYRRVIAEAPQVPDTYIHLMRLLVKQHQPDEAVEVCRQMAQQPGLQYSAFISLGNLQSELERYPEAKAAYQQAIDIDPQQSEAYLALATFCQQHDDMKQSEQVYRQAIAHCPSLASAYLQLSSLLVNQKRTDEALQVLAQMVQQPGLAYSAELAQGDLLLRQERYPEAENAYQRAIAADPQQPEPYLELSAMYQQQNQPDRAELILHQGLQESGTSDFYWALGQLYDQQSQWKQARQAYDEAAKHEPDPVRKSSLYETIGDLLLRQKHFSEAENYLQQALTHNPGNAGAHFSLGELYRYQNKVDLAIEQYTETIQISPQYSTAYRALCQLYGQQGDLTGIGRINRQIKNLSLEPGEKYQIKLAIAQAYINVDLYEWAIQDLQEAIAIMPEQPEGYAWLAWIYAAQRRWDAARQAYETTRQIAPESWHAEIDLRLGLILIQENRLTEAEQVLLNAVSLAPNQLDLTPMIYLSLADIYRRSGQTQKLHDACAAVISLVQGAETPDYHALRQQGLAHFLQSEYAEAAHVLEQTLQVNPEDAKARLYLALNLLCQGQINQAKVEVQRGIDSASSRFDYDYVIEEAERLAAQTPEIPGVREVLQTLREARNPKSL